jgi:hypothetical protein
MRQPAALDRIAESILASRQANATEEIEEINAATRG